MIRLLSHFALLFPNSDATPIDTIPSCIVNIKKETGKILSKYEYKGQDWFSFTNPADTRENNNSDKMTTRFFYDANCKVVAHWTKGGIAGINKIVPDTIQKEKIVLIKKINADSIKISKPLRKDLPDSIQKLALLKKSEWIEETVYDGNLVYRFQSSPDNASDYKITFVDPYFDESGNIITPVKFTRRAFWWHKYNGRFSKTQFRPGYK